MRHVEEAVVVSDHHEPHEAVADPILYSGGGFGAAGRTGCADLVAPELALMPPLKCSATAKAKRRGRCTHVGIRPTAGCSAIGVHHGRAGGAAANQQKVGGLPDVRSRGLVHCRTVLSRATTHSCTLLGQTTLWTN